MNRLLTMFRTVKVTLSSDFLPDVPGAMLAGMACRANLCWPCKPLKVLSSAH